MSNQIKNIIILGGGSAGWLTAAFLASQYAPAEDGIKISLIESPDVPTIGVGEGTWPSMRTTLKKIGISETEFIRECDVSFKQGSKFRSWVNDDKSAYYHPFTLPLGDGDINLAEAWLRNSNGVSFADAVCSQRWISDQHLGPKLITTPEYADIVSYGYHLDAGKFSKLLQRHCVEKLGVSLIVDHVDEVLTKENGDISALVTRGSGTHEADLFIDCSGTHARLIGQHYGIPVVDKKRYLFNDSALAVQVPYVEQNTPIESCTLSTAKSMGWVWDIGLPTRRGVGHVFSSSHTSDDEVASSLREYIADSIGIQRASQLEFRKLTFEPGHRESFWYKNCVAVGMAAGFIEPLEATALVLIELSAQTIAERMPANREQMKWVEKYFNRTFTQHWNRIVEFLKLHYLLSQRKDSDYWNDHHSDEFMPDGLLEQLDYWKFHVPWRKDIRSDEMFPWASYQYILYGMGFKSDVSYRHRRDQDMLTKEAERLFAANQDRTKKLISGLIPTRELLLKINQFGLQKL